MTTRAVHLEISNDLSTDSFILSLKRFIARRVQVKRLMSDNGTNFIGAERELREALNGIDQNRITNFLSQHSIDWKFNPPSSPWMGRIWEALIKSVKRALKVVIQDRLFTDETLATLMCEVESILNQRPLTYVSDDVNDYECLTPNHFLIGECSDFSPTEISDKSLNLRKKWKVVQAASQIFWKRWIHEYLPLLTIRRKWNNQIRNIKIGDLVLLKSDNVPRSHWPLARITNTFPGRDDIVRTVELKTPNAVLVRPVGKICLLEKMD